LTAAADPSATMPADFDPVSLFHDLDASDALAVAVSGGSDSLALLLLADDYLRHHRPRTRLLAITVDHGLRPASAAEADEVAAFCAARGIAHETVRWQGDKPASGLAAAAREARHRLLADKATRFGAGIVLTGHTRDDQAETVAMRAARGEGSGLAGLARATLFDGRVWFARPLLCIRRQALREWLGQRGIGWIDDPSNDDPGYERVRTRRSLGENEVAALAARAQDEGRRREAMAESAAALVARFAGQPAPGLLRLDHGFFDADEATATLARRALLATAGGAPRLPDEARVKALFERLQQEPLRATLSRAVIDARRAGVFLHREARDLPSIAVTGEAQLWDGRRRIAVTSPAPGYTIRPLGPDAVPIAAEAPPALIRAAMAAEPGLYRGGAFVSALSAVPAVAPCARFLPGFDHPLAEALHRLVGAPALPRPPWRRHNGTGA
jgi:tRNA(Ile)-lysidine synthase